MSFNSLPQEIINKIIELTVEEEVVLEEDYERRTILLRLALISRVFTNHSQVVLWRYIILYFDNPDRNRKKSRSLRIGFKKEKKYKVQHLSFTSSVKNHFIWLSMGNFLREIISGVEEIVALTLKADSLPNYSMMPAVFALPSLRSK